MCFSHVNAHQRVISAEEDFNKQADGWPTLWTPLSLSSGSPVNVQWAHEQIGHGGRDGVYVWDQQCELLLIKADPALATTGCPNCQQQRPTQRH